MSKPFLNLSDIGFIAALVAVARNENTRKIMYIDRDADLFGVNNLYG